MRYRIESIKMTEEFDGSLEEAIARATAINDEYQPAFGVQVTAPSEADESAGFTVIVFDTESGEDDRGVANAKQ